MVVFFCNIIFILILIILMTLLCSIKIKIINLEIKNYNDVKSILKEAMSKQYADIFNYIDFTIKVQLCLFYKIPIISFKITNMKFKNILQKILAKKMKKKFNKIKKDEFVKKILSKVIVDKLEFWLNLGTENASFTAIIVSLINIAMSIIVPLFISIKNGEKFKYQVTPIYLSKEAFKLKTSMEISLPII